MEDYIKATKQKIKQLEREINESSATDTEKRNMRHSLSKINTFSDDVFSEVVKCKIELLALKPHFKMRGEIIEDFEKKLNINRASARNDG